MNVSIGERETKLLALQETLRASLSEGGAHDDDELGTALAPKTFPLHPRLFRV